jgi:hypothetical protein
LQYINLMRLFFVFLTTSFLSLQVAIAQSDRGFSGTWKLNPSRSEIHMTVPPDPYLKVEQTATTLTWSASIEETGDVTTTFSYYLDGKPKKREVGDSTTNTVTKWEGAALLVNTIVSGPQNYTVMERWTRSREGNTLTVRQTIVRLGNETESTLVYDNAALGAGLQARQLETLSTPRPMATSPAQASDTATDYSVESGTRILLRLTNSVNTKHTVAGDRVYLETAVPIFVGGRQIIPRGSYVTGTVIDARQAGRVKGKSSINLRFDSLTLPNGISRSLRSLPGGVDTRGNLDRKEGKIEGEGNKGGDARTIGTTTVAGTGIGAAAGAASGHLGMGAGIGAAAGAAAGLAAVLGSRGPDVVLPQGTTMELVLDRELRYSDAELRSRAQ